MAELNAQLTQIARTTIAEMREWGWPDDDIQWSASGAILKHCEAQDIDFEPTKENMAAILALVKQCLKEPQEPALRECPYCHQMHQAEHIERCPLKPQKDATAYNREMDERNRIIRENVEKPWLPLHDGE